MKYYIIAGEASGDLHGANLIKGLKKEDASATFRVFGGDKMAAASSSELVMHYKDIAFMGFVEVAKNIRTIWKGIQLCKDDIIAYQPDALILIDYPGFNLRIADFAKEKGIKVLYYISPQVWAWRSSRVNKIKKIVDQMYVILPFEKAFYKDWDMEVEYVGHPLLDAVAQRQNNVSPNQNPVGADLCVRPPDDKTLVPNDKVGADLCVRPPENPDSPPNNDIDPSTPVGADLCVRPPQDNVNLPSKSIIALLPGSRQQEVRKMLPIMLETAQAFPDHQFVIGGAPALSADFYKSIIGAQKIDIVYNQTYDLLSKAKAALVTSGTATLETALFDVPQVVLYKGNWLSYMIGRMLVNVKYISLVNLILDREVVKELIQGDCTPQQVQKELSSLLSHPDALKADYQELKTILGGQGASQRAAQKMFTFLMNERLSV